MMLREKFPKKNYKIPLNRANILRKGSDITLISSSYMVVECLRAATFLKNFSVNCEVVDIQCLRPLDIKTILKSVKKTKKVIIVDNGGMNYGISSEIMAKTYENLNLKEKANITIKRIGLLDSPIPSTRELAKYCYPDYFSIINLVQNILKRKFKGLESLKSKIPSDQPNKSFLGPF